MQFIKNEEITKIREGKQKDAAKEARILIEKHERDIALAFEKQARESALKEGFKFELDLTLPFATDTDVLKLMAEFLIKDIVDAGYWAPSREIEVLKVREEAAKANSSRVRFTLLARPGDDPLIEASFYIDVLFRGKDIKQ